jgi:high-affinity iron transporter
MVRRVLVLVAALAAGCAPGGAGPDRALSPEQEAARRLSAILDYVAADYPTVMDGVGVTDSVEYAEQLSFLREAGDVAATLAPSDGWLPRAVREIEGQVADTVPGEVVAEAVRAVRSQLLDEYGVRLVPARRPSLARAEGVYAESCASCHGVNGAGDGPAAASMLPAPADFRNPAVTASLSPASAFNTVTDGIRGTGMPSFSTLSARDRWSVAFYVLGLRHEGASASRTALSAAVELPRDLLGRDTMAVLATSTDGELMAHLSEGGMTVGEQGRALAELRADLPFRPQAGADLRSVMAALDQAVWAYEAGDPASARATLTAAYLDGVEPVESTLRDRDPDLVTRIEWGFISLRKQSREGVSASDFAGGAVALRSDLSTAEAALAGTEDRVMPFVAAGLILLREGLESALLISLLIGLVRQAGERRDVMVAHLGWISALALGAVTWFASAWVIRMGGVQREVIEGGVTLIAAAALVYAGHFVLAGADAGRRVRRLKVRIASGSASGRFLMLFGLAFVAVYREAFEVVLFLQAVLVQNPGSGWLVLTGSLAGLAVCLVLAVGIIRLGARLNPSRVLTGTGALLCAFAVVMVGKGLHALQEAGVVGIRYFAVPRIDWLGVYPTVQTVGSQLLLLAAITLLAVAAHTRLRSAARPA